MISVSRNNHCNVKKPFNRYLLFSLLLCGALFIKLCSLCSLFQMGGTPFGGLGAPNMDQMAAMGLPGPNMNPQVSMSSVTFKATATNKMFMWCFSVWLVSLSGSFCWFPQANAVHGPQVRNYPSHVSHVCNSDEICLYLNNWWHLQIESVSSRAELESRAENRCLQ